MTKYLSFQEFGQESELTQVAEEKCPRIDASRLPCITKINHMVNDLGKLLSIMKYIDETIFERRYGRIAQLMRLPVQAAAIKALLNFWDPSYRCFTFGNIDMTPNLEEYERILDFPNNNHRIYLRRRFEDTASEVVSLLGLGKISQCRVADGGFKWKVIEARMKKNSEEVKLGDERYRLVAFAIFGLVLFPSEIGVISLEAASVFIEYERDRINPSSAVLGETMLSLNHCRTHGKGAMRCCIPMLYLWIISHIETPRDIFNNFWWFDLRPLKVTMDETWKNWDEKAWIDKYAVLPRSNFKWKAPWMNNAICTMSCGSKIWVPLIGVTGYISYAPALVTRQLGGMQYAPRTLGLADFVGLFKYQPFLEEMKLIRQDWERPLMVKREEGSNFETSFS